MSEPTDRAVTEAVERVESILVGKPSTGMVLVPVSDLRTLLTALAARDAEIGGLREAGTCDWTLDDSPDDDIWYSGCGQEWLFNAGGPAENGCKFCHHCGKPVVVDARTPTEDGE